MDRVVATAGGAAALFSAGLVIVAQGVFDPRADTVERLVGGGILIGVGTVVVRWMFKLLGAVRDDASQARAVLEVERYAWKEERDSLRLQLAEQRALYEAERSLRLSLEEKGIVDRRRQDGS